MRALLKLFAVSGRVLLVAVLSIGLVEIALQIASGSLPDTLTQRLPQYPLRYGIRFDTAHGARQYPAHETVDITVDAYSGDLYTISCVRPDAIPEVEPYRVTYRRDSHGFRNAEPYPDAAELVVVGDSFTAAEMIQRPYWQDLSSATLVLGLPGSGSLEQTLLLREYGLPRSPDVVIMAYFSGNDLADSVRFYEAQQAGLTLYELANQDRKPWEYLVTFQLAMLLRDVVTGPGPQDCPYPIYDKNGTPLVFYDRFLRDGSRIAANLMSSEAFDITRTAIRQAAEASRESGASFVLVYIPHKAEVYFPLLDPTTVQELHRHIGSDFDLETLRAQRDLLAELAAAEGFAFLDLTPAFQQAAAEGEMLYFFADTHWDQKGHDLARQTLRGFLRSQNLLAQE